MARCSALKRGSRPISAMSRGRGRARRSRRGCERRPRRHDHDPSERAIASPRSSVREEHRLAVGGPEVEEEVAHDLTRLRVKGPEGLVHEQDFGVADQHLCQRHALALPAREQCR